MYLLNDDISLAMMDGPNADKLSKLHANADSPIPCIYICTRNFLNANTYILWKMKNKFSYKMTMESYSE